MNTVKNDHTAGHTRAGQPRGAASRAEAPGRSALSAGHPPLGCRLAGVQAPRETQLLAGFAGAPRSAQRVLGSQGRSVTALTAAAFGQTERGADAGPAPASFQGTARGLGPGKGFLPAGASSGVTLTTDNVRNRGASLRWAARGGLSFPRSPAALGSERLGHEQRQYTTT